MLEIIGFIVVGLIAIGIAVAIVYVAVNVILILLPIALVIVAIYVFCVFFCDGSKSFDFDGFKQSQRLERVEKVGQRIVKARTQAQQIFHERVIGATRQKAEVNLSTIRPEIDSAIARVVKAYRLFTEDYSFMPLITSADDYEGHATRSAHYEGAAVDFRIKDMGDLEDRRELVQMICDELDERFLVLHEDVGTSNEHVHVQLRSGTYDRNVTWR